MSKTLLEILEKALDKSSALTEETPEEKNAEDSVEEEVSLIEKLAATLELVAGSLDTVVGPTKEASLGKSYPKTNESKMLPKQKPVKATSAPAPKLDSLGKMKTNETKMLKKYPADLALVKKAMFDRLLEKYTKEELLEKLSAFDPVAEPLKGKPKQPEVSAVQSNSAVGATKPKDALPQKKKDLNKLFAHKAYKDKDLKNQLSNVAKAGPENC